LTAEFSNAAEEQEGATIVRGAGATKCSSPDIGFAVGTAASAEDDKRAEQRSNNDDVFMYGTQTVFGERERLLMPSLH
jgi:hypothetical protein